MSGPELQQELIRRRQEIPIVFITAQGDESVRPRLLARRGRRVPVQAVQRDGPARRTQRRASDEVSMTTMFTRNVARGPYTVSSAIAARSIEVVTMPDVTSIVFVVDDDVSGARIAGAADQNRRLAARNVRVGTGIPVPPPRHGSVLPGARRDAAGAQRPRAAAAARRADGHADHLHHRPRRRAHERAGDEGRSRRVPDEAVQGRRAVGRHPRCHRAQSRRTPSRLGDASACRTATRH